MASASSNIVKKIVLVSTSLICALLFFGCNNFIEPNSKTNQIDDSIKNIVSFKFDKNPADQVININSMVYDAHPASIGIDWNAKDKVPYPCDSLFNAYGIYYDKEFECWRLSEQARKEFERKKQEEVEAYKKTENRKNVAKPTGIHTEPKQSLQNREEKIVTNYHEEFPVIEKPSTNLPPQEQPIEEPKPNVNNKALFKGSNNPQAGGSEGITGKPGDQGKPNGLAGVRQYDGNGGKGNGTGYDLGGRGAKSLHRPDGDFSEDGKIVVDIWVNRAGQVVRAEVADKGTDIINNAMRQKAIQAAKRSTFAAAPDAPEEQHGIITYTFVINQ